MGFCLKERFPFLVSVPYNRQTFARCLRMRIAPSQQDNWFIASFFILLSLKLLYVTQGEIKQQI